MDNTLGSVWSRWDLHVHTPETLKNDQYDGKSPEEKWDNFYKAIASYVGDGTDPCRTIKAIGITDYLSIDNYLKVRDEHRLPKCIELVLPNVEMRMSLIATKSPVNIHFIFDPAIADQLKDRFFSKLTFSYGESSFSASRSELVRLGKMLDPSAPDEKAYKLGAEQYLIDFSVLRTLFKGDPELREHTLIVVANSSNDGASGIGRGGANSQSDALRKDLYHFVDAIFSSQPSDQKYFIGKGPDSPSKIQELYGSLMPCIHGSDAHSLERLFEPSEKRYCWIKAEPTFSGLKQILYEPEARVRIQSLPPERKSDYLIIDSLQIDHADFGKQTIPFNPGLNTIIGGRSSGKSILLGCLAKLCKNDTPVKQDKPAYDQYLDSLVPHMHLQWRDQADADNRKIDFFPQGHIIDVASDPKKIADLVENLLHDNPAYQKSLNDLEQTLTMQPSVIHQLFSEYSMQSNAKAALLESLEALGNKDGVQREIQKIKTSLDALLQAMPQAFSAESKAFFDAKNTELDAKKKSKATAEAELESLKGIQQLELARELDLQGYGLSDELARKIGGIRSSLVEQLQKEWNRKIQALIDVQKLSIQSLKAEIDTVQSDETYRRIKDAYTKNQAYLQMEKSLSAEKKRLDSIISLEKQLDAISGQLRKLRAKLLAAYNVFYQANETYRTSVHLTKGDVSITPCIVFDSSAYQSFIESCFDGRSSKYRERSDFNFTTNEAFITHATQIVDDLFDHASGLKSKCSPLQAAEDFLSMNLFHIHYNIEYQGDHLSSMSEGKSAFVILRILLDFSENDCPILIDQPEDDLDNRAIYFELVKYLREKKQHRQIILVTHNPNIVVGADAEEIIVANQNGISNPNPDHVKFMYRSGALENSFSEDIPKKKSPKKMCDVLSSKGIREHVCEILEGGEQAFRVREDKYQL